MIVVVVIPFCVVETSLTTVLDELPPPPDPDCEDEADDVADVDEAVDVDDVDDVDVVDEDEFAALDGVAVTAAVEEAIALIDMKTHLKGPRARRRMRALFSPSTRCMREAGAPPAKIITSGRISPANIRNHLARHGLQLLPACPETPRMGLISSRSP